MVLSGAEAVVENGGIINRVYMIIINSQDWYIHDSSMRKDIEETVLCAG